MMKWKNKVSEVFRKSLIDAEEVADVAWRRFAQRMGFNAPRQIVAYRGYGNAERVWVQGRLLSNRLYGGPKDDDGWWDNLMASYQRWESDELPGEEIRLRYGASEVTVVTDDEGYYHAEFPLTGEDAVFATHVGDGVALSATHRLTLLDERAEYLVISDVDDTIIQTGITDLLLAAQLTFLNNAKTRKPLTGAASLYRAFVAGRSGNSANPVFYLSNSAWNMYDLLHDFLDLNDFPSGPLLLRDLGFGTDSSNHKIDTIRQLLQRFQSLPVVLVGDSGQHDAEIYARVVENNSDRVKAVYIRDIDPDGDSAFDRKVDEIIARSEAHGVPFQRVRDSDDVARHAAEIGLLPQQSIPEVADDVEVDKRREPL